MFRSQNLEKEIRALLQGALPQQRAERLRHRLKEDAEARALYDRLAEAEAALDVTSDASGLGGSGTHRVEERLFETLEAKPAAAPRWPWRSWVAVSALGASALAAVVISVTPTVPEPDDRYRTRSGEGKSLDADHVLQVLRVSFNEQGAASVTPAKRLAPGDHLRFAVFTRSRGGSLSLFAVRDGGAKREVLLNRTKIAPSSKAERLNFPFEVPPGWSGSVRFVAVFDHGGTVDPAIVSLEPRDEPNVSVRAVTAVVEEST